MQMAGQIEMQFNTYLVVFPLNFQYKKKKFHNHDRNKNKLTNQSLLQVEHNVHLHHVGYLKNTQYFDFYQR